MWIMIYALIFTNIIVRSVSDHYNRPRPYGFKGKYRKYEIRAETMAHCMMFSKKTNWAKIDIGSRRFFYYLYNPIIYNAKVTCIWIPRYLQNVSGVPKQSSCWSPLLYISQCQGVFTIPFIFSILEYFTDAEKKNTINSH